jgi:carbonic anhydrase
MKKNYWEARVALTPKKVLQLLKVGNERFLNNLHLHRNLLQLVNDTAEQQFPLATVLSCSDSRVPTELVFDQSLGDIFSIRLAGNIASTNAIASMEFACKVLKSKLIVVLGHTNCGAIKGACDNIHMGNLAHLLDHIKPAVARETETVRDRTSHNKTFVSKVARLNINYQIEEILKQSEILREMIHHQEIGLIGAQYDVHTGKVTFYDEQAVFSFVEKMPAIPLAQR